MEVLARTAEGLGLPLEAHQLRQFEEYYHQLIAANRRVNLTSITDYQEVQRRHFGESLAVGAALTLGPVVYRTVERIQFFMVAVMIVLTIIIMVLTLKAVAVKEMLVGTVMVGHVPEGIELPLLLGAIAYAGAGGALTFGNGDLPHLAAEFRWDGRARRNRRWSRRGSDRPDGAPARRSSAPRG